MSDELARSLFVAGTLPLGVAGLGHAILALGDVRRPRAFTPTDDAVRHSMAATGVRLAARWTKLRGRRTRAPGSSRRSLWRAWLGFNISHGLGIVAFNAVLLVLAIQDFGVFREFVVLAPLAITVSTGYLVLAIRFWFFGPVLIAATSTALFVASTAVMVMS